MHQTVPPTTYTQGFILMSDPVSIGLMIASTAASVGLQVAAAKAAQSQANADARALEEAAKVERADIQRKNKRFYETIPGAYAAGNVDIGTGSPLDVMGDAVREGELAAMRGEFNLNEQARRARYAGDLAAFQGYTGAASTILGTAGTLGMMNAKNTPRTGDPGNPGGIPRATTKPKVRRYP